MADQDKLMRRMAGIERVLWFAVLPGGPLLILAGLWLAMSYSAMLPVQQGVVTFWARFGNYYWFVAGALLATAVWVRLNFYTPEALQRMQPPSNENLSKLFSSEGLDEDGRRRIELWRKLIVRNFILLGILDAPVIILIGLYPVVELRWFLEFAVAYSVVVAFLFRPTSPMDLVNAAAKLPPFADNKAAN